MGSSPVFLGDLDMPTFHLLSRTDQTSISTNTTKDMNGGNGASHNNSASSEAEVALLS